MVEALDFGKGGLEAVPLGFVFGAAGGDGDGVFECGIVGPEGEFFEGGAAGEELKKGNWRLVEKCEWEEGGVECVRGRKSKRGERKREGKNHKGNKRLERNQRGSFACR